MLIFYLLPVLLLLSSARTTNAADTTTYAAAAENTNAFEECANTAGPVRNECGVVGGVSAADEAACRAQVRPCCLLWCFWFWCNMSLYGKYSQVIEPLNNTNSLGM